jgi:hypothetical protein
VLCWTERSAGERSVTGSPLLNNNNMPLIVPPKCQNLSVANLANYRTLLEPAVRPGTVDECRRQPNGVSRAASGQPLIADVFFQANLSIDRPL